MYGVDERLWNRFHNIRAKTRISEGGLEMVIPIHWRAERFRPHATQVAAPNPDRNGGDPESYSRGVPKKISVPPRTGTGRLSHGSEDISLSLNIK
jgi:hypothetical protein